MARKYYIWSDPACGGKNVVWEEVTGREFKSMMRLPQNRKRRFIRLGNEICPEADIITIEAPEPVYAEWKREQNAAEYRARLRRGFTAVSFETEPCEGDADTLHEVVGDSRVDVERTALYHIARTQLKKGLASLTSDEARLLGAVYAEGKTCAEIARAGGVHRSTTQRRLTSVQSRLQNFF